MAANVELQLQFAGKYRRALSIPLTTCQRFSVHPLTWLRYLGFTIFGNKGHISNSPHGREVDYYQDIVKPGTYYYVSWQEAFLLDPDLMDDQSSERSASTISTERESFRNKVVDRDGTCVMTGVDAEYAEACHIVPHAKGNQYLINFIRHRHRHDESIGDPPLNDINDTRNGILLALQLYASFGASQVAFLQTPNFAMTVNDVDLVAQPNADELELGFVTPCRPLDGAGRLTLQHFTTKDRIIMCMAPHNSDARQSPARGNNNEWPPALIFDASYGCAALNAWGVPRFRKFARKATREVYYYNHGDGDGDGDGDGGGGGGEDGRNGGNGGDDSDVLDAAGAEEGPSRQAHRRNARRALRRTRLKKVGRRQTSNTTQEEPGLADMILALWMQNAAKKGQQYQAQKVDRAREKVRTWLDSTDGPEY